MLTKKTSTLACLACPHTPLVHLRHDINSHWPRALWGRNMQSLGGWVASGSGSCQHVASSCPVSQPFVTICRPRCAACVGVPHVYHCTKQNAHCMRTRIFTAFCLAANTGQPRRAHWCQAVQPGHQCRPGMLRRQPPDEVSCMPATSGGDAITCRLLSLSHHM